MRSGMGVQHISRQNRNRPNIGSIRRTKSSLPAVSESESCACHLIGHRQNQNSRNSLQVRPTQIQVTRLSSWAATCCTQKRHEYTERTSEKPTELGYLNCCMSRLFESCLLTYLLDNRCEALGNTGKPGRLQDLQEPQSAILVMQKQFLCKPASSETMIASRCKNELNKT